jgi:hypothetical protein
MVAFSPVPILTRRGNMDNEEKVAAILKVLHDLRDGRGVSERNQESFANSRDAVLAMADVVNGGARDVIRAGIVSGILGSHRYLQELLIEEIIGALGDLGTLYKANPSRFADGRNEYGMKLCAKLRDKLDSDYYFGFGR